MRHVMLAERAAETDTGSARAPRRERGEVRRPDIGGHGSGVTTDLHSLGALYADKAAYVAAARRILNCQALAEDVVQDVMLRLAAAPPAARIETQAAYVARMVRNLAIDRARRRRFETRTFSGLDHPIAGSLSDGADPEQATVANQSLRLAEAAVDALPEPVRTVFRLHRIEGVPQNEIAARMGVSRALVCGLVRRGHVRCLAALDGAACGRHGCLLDASDDASDPDGTRGAGAERRHPGRIRHASVASADAR